ncbi:endonuclease/exonuclease/phosphatase family protein [Nocardia inohanensis]|uniref:endonuclease/exonuclease/phosphatase family protein n=1 Tax=Nocardia inohanensis TaxID=209246 RepID=UPI00082A9737|nr:endonuclease/exonuclease/phosphatase family protein [Nocardia inohanensis]
MIGTGGRTAPKAIVFATAAAVLTFALLGHEWIPDIAGSGAVLDAAVPWLGLLVPVLAVTAVLLRSPAGAVTMLVPLLAWAYVFGAWWAPRPAAATPGGGLTVVSQNLFAANGSPVATARALLSADADVVAVQEFAGSNRAPVQRILDDAYPYREQLGTVALWSRYPTSDAEPADVGIGWTRGLRTRIAAPGGDVVAYVVHLPSIRPGESAGRDHGLAVLSRQLTGEPAERVLVAGDFNTATTDRNWSGFAPGYRDALSAGGSGPGFTWPSSFPLVRLDHVLVRGGAVDSASVLRTPGPDHRAVRATIGF